MVKRYGKDDSCVCHRHRLHGPVTGGMRQVKKVPDARHGRSCMRAMENRAKGKTIPRSVHGPRQVPTTGGTGTSEKKFPTPVGDGAARVPWKTGQKHIRFHDPYTDQYTYPERAVRGHGKKSPRRPSWTELYVCHGKHGKSTDDSMIRIRTSTRTQNGPYGDK